MQMGSGGMISQLSNRGPTRAECSNYDKSIFPPFPLRIIEFNSQPHQASVKSQTHYLLPSIFCHGCPSFLRYRKAFQRRELR